VQNPRYPLLHQQPLFTEGHWARIARLPRDLPVPKYDPNALPRTQMLSGSLIRLPSFPQAERDLLDQYAEAFEKVISHTSELTGMNVAAAAS
jgi:perosamine synthetase